LGGSYLDSLDYTDRLLGQMLRILEKQPRWSSTMLIVQGDHSWRTQMWRPLPGWSAEDERISHGGQWDPRPLVMVHAPGQQDPRTVAAPTSLMFVHDEVAAEIRAIAQCPAHP
jgi:phosphoglycerol transferase MdoB-like AlkP superfamily enzyme